MAWQDLLSGFVTFDKKEPEKLDPKKPIKGQVTNKEDNATPAVVSYDQLTPINAFGGATINPDVRAHLLGLIKENNFEGFDYCEFSVQLEIAKAWPIPLEQKYQSSFSAVKGQAELAKKDFDKPKLVTTAAKYKTIIQNAVTSFENDYAATYKVEVEDKKALVQTKAEKMQELSKQMASLNDEIQQLNITIAQADAQLKTNKEMFVTTGNAVLAEIDSEIEKINLYIS
jgi:hypothetical protein